MKKPKFNLDPSDPMMEFFIKGYMAANLGCVPTFDQLKDWVSREVEKQIIYTEEEEQ